MLPAEHALSLSDLIPTELIQQALTLTDTVTLRKRKLPGGWQKFSSVFMLRLNDFD
ncbi:hypothetical protein TUM20903_39500 [Citrobacter koseri]|nr:hypothetical protein TUM13189_39690 [Citrobacter koseri]BDG91212.1 hypothetical protein TUM20903_39500 [Citrobacter koseri]